MDASAGDPNRFALFHVAKPSDGTYDAVGDCTQWLSVIAPNLEETKKKRKKKEKVDGKIEEHQGP